jgi:lipoprotein-releasing system permease protein
LSLPRLIAHRFARSLRDVRFARFTTVVSVVSVALGCMALIVAISVLNGYDLAMERSALQFTAHVEVLPARTATLEWDAQRAHAFLRDKVPGIERVESVVTREGLLRSSNGIEGVMLTGLPAERLQQRIAPLVVRGSLPTGTEAVAGVVIGSVLAERLHSNVGDTIVLFTAENPYAEQPLPIIVPCRVSGIIATGMRKTDESVVATTIEAARRMLRLPATEESSVALFLTDIADANRVRSQIYDLFSQGIVVATYRDRHADMYQWIALQKQPVPIVLGLIILVAMLTVVSTLIIAVIEKTPSLAILRCLGMSGRSLMGIVMLHGLRIGLTGASIGTGIAAAFLWAQRTFDLIGLDGAIYYVTSLPVSFEWQPFVVVPLIALALSVGASLIPVIIALRIPPTAALRFD